MSTVKLRVLGRRGSYSRKTLATWLHELREFLQGELGVEVEVVEEDLDVDVPVLYVDDQVLLIGLPGEEGYLIEALRKAFRSQASLG